MAIITWLLLQGKGKPHRVQKHLKLASPKQRLGNKDEKTCKSRKKGITPNWPRLKILGC